MTIFEFLRQLEERRVLFRLEKFRESLMVSLAVPGERWEVEFFEDGSVEVERFLSRGEVGDSSMLETLWQLTE